MMSKKEQAGFNFSSVDLLIYMWNKRWILIIVSFLAAVTSIIVSLQITEKYKSTVVMFPTMGASVSALLSDNYTGRQSVYGFGEEEQAEQLLQVLNSEQIRSKIIEKYNLMEHYEIDTTSKYPYTELLNMYKSNINFRRTELMSVEISVLDTDPQQAADIANDISNLIDTVYNKMKSERAQTAFEMVTTELQEATVNVRLLQDSLENIGKQVSSSLRRLEGSSAAQLTTALAQYGGPFISLTKDVEHHTRRYAFLKQRYQEARMEVNQRLSYKFIVDKAYPSEKKAYPKRSIIVLVSTASAFLFTLIMLIIIDSIQHRTIAKRDD